MKSIKYLLGVIAGLVGLLFYTRGKQKTAEAVNENVEVKEEVQKTQAKIDLASATIKAEEDKRKEITHVATEEKYKPITDADVLDFFKRIK